MKIFVISDNADTCTGLRLAGIDGVVVHTRPELKTAISKVKEDKEIGILLIVEKISTMFSEDINNLRLGASLPLIVEIPDRHGTGRKSNFIESYIQEAIGVKL